MGWWVEAEEEVILAPYNELIFHGRLNTHVDKR